MTTTGTYFCNLYMYKNGICVIVYAKLYKFESGAGEFDRGKYCSTILFITVCQFTVATNLTPHILIRQPKFTALYPFSLPVSSS
jgi:hypothetical protein